MFDNKLFPTSDALMILKTKDGRVLFAVPWLDVIVLGTTDTQQSKICEEPVALEEEINFMLEEFNLYNQVKITRADIKSIYAGLRPLVKTSNKRTSQASRDHAIIVSKPNLITIPGGKWTTYRKKAEEALNKAVLVAELPNIKCSTRNLRLHGYLKSAVYGQPLSQYGSDASKIIEIMNEQISYSERIHPDHPFTIAELEWCVKNEMAMQVEDILARRSRMLFVDAHAAISSSEKTARLMAPLLRRDEQWVQHQIIVFYEMAKGYFAKINSH